jgi:hypothetical protein
MGCSRDDAGQRFDVGIDRCDLDRFIRVMMRLARILRR